MDNELAWLAGIQDENNLLLIKEQIKAMFSANDNGDDAIKISWCLDKAKVFLQTICSSAPRTMLMQMINMPCNRETFFRLDYFGHKIGEEISTHDQRSAYPALIRKTRSSTDKLEDSTDNRKELRMKIRRIKQKAYVLAQYNGTSNKLCIKQ
uniref:Uncharacterized protein n=1 Tax=Romanomermis culicivorax TaxID=13658 RepID=A0A915HW37_ROMCU